MNNARFVISVDKPEILLIALRKTDHTKTTLNFKLSTPNRVVKIHKLQRLSYFKVLQSCST